MNCPRIIVKMSTNQLLEALTQIDRRPKLISDIEELYPGSIFADVCNLIRNFSENNYATHDHLLVQCVTYALKALSLFSEYEECKISNILLPILNILKLPTNTAELTLVAATAWAKVVCTLNPDVSIARNGLLQQIESSTNDDLNIITLIDGTLNCGHNEVIIDERFLANLFEKIQPSCLQTSGHLFQSFQVFKAWSLRLKQLKSPESINSQFLSSGKIIRSANLVIFKNWENPVRGIPDLLENILANICDFLEIFDARNYMNYLNGLYETNVQNVLWKSKGKYRTLNVLLPRVGITELLEREKQFGRELCQSLGSNHLVSVGVAVYKTVLKNISVDLWERQFLHPLTECLLNNKNELIQSNANIYWLPTSIRILPASGDLLFKKIEESEVTKESWEAKLIILKNQRSLGHISQLDQHHLCSVEEGLLHTKLDVRIAAFSVLCLANKKGCPPPNKEMDLIIKFIRENLVIDSSSFRQVMKSNFVQVVTRCRDIAVVTHRKLMKCRKAKSNDNQRTTHIEEQEAVLVQIMNQLNEIMQSLFENLFPGANYQRLITCLELLDVISDCFFKFEANKGINKGSSNGDPSELVRYISEKYQLLDLYKKREHCEILLSCVLHYMEDVRFCAFELLKNFDPKYVAEEKSILKKALELSCSPKYGECESASVLFHLCVYWFNEPGKVWLDQLRSIKLKENYSLLAQAIAAASNKNNQSSRSFLTKELLRIYQNLIDQANSNDRKDFLKFAKFAPMHGLLTGMRVCLSTEISVNADTDLDFRSFITSLIDTLILSVDLMVSTMCGGKKSLSDQAASFADMGIAIDNLIEETGKQHETTSMEDDFSISDEHSLILACMWLNIKSCSLMAAQIVTIYKLGHHDTLRCGELLATILTKCRHKGAMENAMYAMEDFCAALMADKNHQMRDIPRQLLDKVLNDLDSGHDVSVTRRSAGLPMLVQKIVSTEPRGLGGQTRTLLSKAIQKLINIANKPINVMQELYDMPQSHALHILRVLVQDSSLSFDVVQYCDEILVCCVDNFTSDSWSIRFDKNYAL